MPLTKLDTGATLHYERLNADASGPPVIVIHGLLGTARLHLGSVMEWLAEQGYPVYGLTLRGYGESLPRPRDFPFRFYNRDAQDVLAFVETLGIEQAHLLGYSDGGEVALICSGEQPQHFLSVTTIGSVGYMGPEVRPHVQSYRPGHMWITEDEQKLHGITDPDDFARQWVRATVLLVDSGGDVALSLAPKITASVLLMLGESDKLNPSRYAEKFLEEVKNGRVQMFATGHPIHEEAPNEFKAAFLAHLQSV